MKEICACDILEKEDVQKIRVFVTKKKFKKLVTIIEGIDKGKIEDTARELKTRRACGGTAKDGIIILQGDHKSKVKPILVSLGYLESSITVVLSVVK
jgi:translation initiation factor 1